jgi:hypothetical protein
LHRTITRLGGAHKHYPFSVPRRLCLGNVRAEILLFVRHEGRVTIRGETRAARSTLDVQPNSRPDRQCTLAVGLLRDER